MLYLMLSRAIFVIEIKSQNGDGVHLMHHAHDYLFVLKTYYKGSIIFERKEIVKRRMLSIQYYECYFARAYFACMSCTPLITAIWYLTGHY